jgi:hypothetical protein
MSDHSHAVCHKVKHRSYTLGSDGRCHRTTAGVVQSSDIRPLSGFKIHLVDLMVKLIVESLE